MVKKASRFGTVCQDRHGAVSGKARLLGWFAPIAAVIGLWMAIAGASGWGDPLAPAEWQPRSPTSETTEPDVHPIHRPDAGTIDAAFGTGELVGVIPKPTRRVVFRSY